MESSSSSSILSLEDEIELFKHKYLNEDNGKIIRTHINGFFTTIKDVKDALDYESRLRTYNLVYTPLNLSNQDEVINSIHLRLLSEYLKKIKGHYNKFETKIHLYSDENIVNIFKMYINKEDVDYNKKFYYCTHLRQYILAKHDKLAKEMDIDEEININE